MSLMFQDKYKHCQDWYSYTFLSRNFSLYLAIYIVVVNMLLGLLFNWIGDLKRPQNMF